MKCVLALEFDSARNMRHHPEASMGPKIQRSMKAQATELDRHARLVEGYRGFLSAQLRASEAQTQPNACEAHFPGQSHHPDGCEILNGQLW